MRLAKNFEVKIGEVEPALLRGIAKRTIEVAGSMYGMELAAFAGTRPMYKALWLPSRGVKNKVFDFGEAGELPTKKIDPDKLGPLAAKLVKAAERHDVSLPERLVQPYNRQHPTIDLDEMHCAEMQKIVGRRAGWYAQDRVRERIRNGESLGGPSDNYPLYAEELARLL